MQALLKELANLKQQLMDTGPMVWLADNAAELIRGKMPKNPILHGRRHWPEACFIRACQVHGVQQADEASRISVRAPNDHFYARINRRTGVAFDLRGCLPEQQGAF